MPNESKLTFSKLTGKGTIIIENGKSVINAKAFLFKGTIVAHGDCEIYTDTTQEK